MVGKQVYLGRHLTTSLFRRGCCRVPCTSVIRSIYQIVPLRNSRLEGNENVDVLLRIPKHQRLGQVLLAQHSRDNDGLGYRDDAAHGKIRRIAALMTRFCLGLLGITAAIAWCLPAVLSSKAGLRAALHIANTVAPVKLHVDSADIRWRTEKPYLKGVRIACGTEDLIMSVDHMQFSKSLWQMIGRHRKAEVFVRNPIINLETDDQGQFKILNELDQAGVLRVAADQQPMLPPPFRSSVHVKHPFSAEITIDSRISVFISEGSLRLNEEVSQLLGGRLFLVLSQSTPPAIPRVQKSRQLVSDIAVEMDSPAFHLDMKGSQTMEDDLYLDKDSPVHVDTRITQAFSDAVMALINPLLIGGVNVASESPIKMSITSEDGILPSEKMVATVAPWTAKVEQGPLLRDVIRVLTMLGDRSIGSKYQGFRHALEKEFAVSISSSEASVAISNHGRLVTSNIRSLSLQIPGISYPIELGIQATVSGTDPDAPMDAIVEVSAPTLAHILGGDIQYVKPFSIAVRGTLNKPSINFKSVLSDAGLLILQSKMASPLSIR